MSLPTAPENIQYILLYVQWYHISHPYGADDQTCVYTVSLLTLPSRRPCVCDGSLSLQVFWHLRLQYIDPAVCSLVPCSLIREHGIREFRLIKEIKFRVDFHVLFMWLNIAGDSYGSAVSIQGERLCMCKPHCRISVASWRSLGPFMLNLAYCHNKA